MAFNEDNGFKCSDSFCDGDHTTSTETCNDACCDIAVETSLDDIMYHSMSCENYDGAPVEQWEVTTPDSVYDTDDYYDRNLDPYGDGVYDSEIAYLNR